MPVDTPSPTSGDREPTPDLSRSSRHKSDAAPSPAHSRHSSHRSSHRDDDRERGDRDHRSSSRRHRDSRGDDEDEEARRRRKRREREEAGEDDEDPEERRRRRSERREREDRSRRTSRDRDDDERRGGERKRSRSRESGHRSRAGSESGRRGGKTLEERERERADRDREMKNEAREREREREDYYARIDRDRQRERGADRRDDRSPPRRRRRQSPSYDSNSNSADALLGEIDSEARSVFVSQLAAKLTSRDLGLFFEDKLGDRTVTDARIVTDRVSRRSKGIGYVELASIELVEKAIALSGTIVMGLPILVELTEAERNKQAASNTPALLTPLPGAPAIGPGSLPPLAAAQMFAQQIRPVQNALHRDRHAAAEVPYHRLYVGSLNFELTADDIKQVFSPFGELEFVDLHRDSMTGKSKGFCFVQFVELDSAKTALATMNGFELAGRQLRVSTVNEKAAPPRPNLPNLPTGVPYNPASNPALASSSNNGGNMPESLDDPQHGQRLDHAARQALMMKLARTDPPAASATGTSPTPGVHPSRMGMVPAAARPVIPVQLSLYVLVNNMFNPEEETERDWDTDLAEDIKSECEAKYGPVANIKVEKESQGEVYIQFVNLDGSAKAVNGLNGRFFGGRSLVAHFIPEAIFKAHVA